VKFFEKYNLHVALSVIAAALFVGATVSVLEGNPPFDRKAERVRFAPQPGEILWEVELDLSYVITDGGGLGAFSLTPAGEMRWNVPDFGKFDGTGLSRIQFGPERFYFGEDIVPGCDTQGVVTIDFDGNILWCNALGDLARPEAAPHGDVYVRSSNFITSYSTEGNLLWSYNFGFPNDGHIGPSTGPDNSVYIFHHYNDLHKFSPDGTLLWEAENISDPDWPVAPVVSPDNEIVAFSTIGSFGNTPQVVALDPVDASVRWLTLLTPGEFGVARIEFSHDSKVVYVPTAGSNSSLL
jgi:hypothetical protein